MKLYYSGFSPFARKVRITALICGLDKEIELIAVDIMNAPPDNYKKINPLIKLPALQMRDGQMLVNSSFICDYLNSISLGKKVLPFGPERWAIMNDQGIADGACEAAVLRRHEVLRAADKFDTKYDGKQKLKITNALEYFETRTHLCGSDWTLREISAACLLGYLGFRFAEEKFENQFLRLFAWYDKSLQARAELRETAPLAPK